MATRWHVFLGMFSLLAASLVRADQPGSPLVLAQPGTEAVRETVGPVSALPVKDSIWGRANGWVTATEETLWPHGSWALCGLPFRGIASPWDEPVGGCRTHDGFYGSAEYNLWWYKHASVPPLVTTGNPTNMFPGALGQPGTSLLLGTSIDLEERSGGRFAIGYWFDPEQLLGLETSYTFLGRRAVHSDNGSTGALGSQLIARPYFDVTGNLETAEIVASPGQFGGGTQVELTTRLWGLEANLRTTWTCSSWYRVGVFAGVRFLEVSEDLAIGETISPFGSAPTGAKLFDAFGTRNDFYGGQLGGILQLGWGPLGMDLSAKLALGGVTQEVAIRGSTTASDLNGTSRYPVGFLAQKTNIGSYHRDQFAVVPEIGIHLGYQLLDHVRFSIGYDFLYCSDIARPGQQIDRGLNPTQFPTLSGLGTLVGPARPGFTFESSDFWAHGLSLGLEFSY